MKKGEIPIYKQLSNDLLAGFYVEISKNIKKGILSPAMLQEVTLIELAAASRGLTRKDLKEIYLKQIKFLIQTLEKQR